MEPPLDVVQLEFYGEGRGPPMLLAAEEKELSRRRPRKRRKVSTAKKMTTEQLLTFTRRHSRNTPSPSKLPGDFPQQFAHRALAAYSLLRTLSVQLRLSPFTPNVFLRALYLPYPNKLLGDIHVSLLRILLADLNLGYSYKPKGSSLSFHKRRPVDNIRLPLRASDNLTFLDGLSWPLFCDDYCHLTAGRLWAALNDEENHIDFRYLGLQSLGTPDYQDEQFANEAQSNSWAQRYYKPHAMQYSMPMSYHMPVKTQVPSASEVPDQDLDDDSERDYSSDTQDAEAIVGPSKVLDVEGTSAPLKASEQILSKEPYTDFRNRSLLSPGKSKVMDVIESPVPEKVTHYSLAAQRMVTDVKSSPMDTLSSQSSEQAGTAQSPPEERLKPANQIDNEECKTSQVPHSRARLLPLHKKPSAGKRPLDSVETNNHALQNESNIARGMYGGARPMAARPGVMNGLPASNHLQPQAMQMYGADDVSEKPLQVDNDVAGDLRKFMCGIAAAASKTVPPAQSEESNSKAEDDHASESSFKGENHWPHFEPLKAMRSDTPYHRLSIAHKLDILEFLIDELLNVGAIAAEFSRREAMLGYSPFRYGVLPNQKEFDNLMNEDECGICGLEGELLCCDGCICSFHRGCIDMSPTEKLPEGKWLCPECKVADPSNFGPLRGGRKASVDWFHAGEVANVLKVHEEATAAQQVRVNSAMSSFMNATGAPSHLTLNTGALANSAPIQSGNPSLQTSQSMQPGTLNSQYNELPVDTAATKRPIGNQPPSASGIVAVTSKGPNVQAPAEDEGTSVKPIPMPSNLPSNGTTASILKDGQQANPSGGNSTDNKLSNPVNHQIALNIGSSERTSQLVIVEDSKRRKDESFWKAADTSAPNASGIAMVGTTTTPPIAPSTSTCDSKLTNQQQANLGVPPNVETGNDFTARTLVPQAATIMTNSQRTASLTPEAKVALDEYEFLIVHGFVFCRKRSNPSSSPYHIFTKEQTDRTLKGFGASIAEAWPFAQIPVGESYYGSNFPPAKYYFAAFETFNPSYYFNKYRRAPMPLSIIASGGSQLGLTLASYENECNSCVSYKLSEAMLRDMTFDKHVADCIKSERTLFDPYMLVAGYMMKLDATLRKACLLNEFWESGKTSAIHEVWSCNVRKCRSVQKLSKLLLKLVDQIHPRAFLDGWFHNPQLKKAETQVTSERHYEQLPANWDTKKESRKRRWERTPSTMLLSLCARENCDLQFFVRGIRPDVGIQATTIRSKRKKAKTGETSSMKETSSESAFSTGDRHGTELKAGDSNATDVTSATHEQVPTQTPMESQQGFMDVSDIEPPQKPYPAYFQFANHRRLEMKEKYPGVSSVEISRILSIMWKTASDEFKEKFQKEEMKQREEYKIAMEEYHKKVRERYVAMGEGYPGNQLSGNIGPQAFENRGINIGNEDMDEQGKSSIRRSRRSGRIARTSFDMDIQINVASSSIAGVRTVAYPLASDSLELQIEECKRKHIKPIEKLVKSSTQKEKFWPLAGRIAFATLGDLPPNVMKRLGRNAGSAKAPHVAYNTSHEVGQLCWAHLWRKRTEKCSTFEDLIYQARVLESFLDRQAIHSFEGTARRGKSQVQKEVRCSQTDPDSGTVYHFVVNKKSRKGCWISEDLMDVSSLTLELFTRKQKQFALRQERVEAARKIERAEKERLRLAAEVARKNVMAKEEAAVEACLKASSTQKFGSHSSPHGPPQIGIVEVNKQIRNALDQHSKDVRHMLQTFVRIGVLPTETNIKALRQKNMPILRAAANQLQGSVPPVFLAEQHLLDMMKACEKAVAGKPLETFTSLGSAQQSAINGPTGPCGFQEANSVTSLPGNGRGTSVLNAATPYPKQQSHTSPNGSLEMFSPTPIADSLNRKRNANEMPNNSLNWLPKQQQQILEDMVWSDMEDDLEVASSGPPDTNVSNRVQPRSDQPNTATRNQPNPTSRQMHFNYAQNHRSSSSNQRVDFQRGQQVYNQIQTGFNAPPRQYGIVQQPEQALMNGDYANQIQKKHYSQQSSQQMIQQLQPLPSQHFMIQRQLQQQSQLPPAPQQHATLHPQYMGYQQALYQQQQQPLARPSPQQGFFQPQSNQQMQQLQGWMSRNNFPQS